MIFITIINVIPSIQPQNVTYHHGLPLRTTLQIFLISSDKCLAAVVLEEERENISPVIFQYTLLQHYHQQHHL